MAVEEKQHNFRQFTPGTPISALLERNRVWAARQAEQEPQLFPSIARGQSPQILWIGCSDSRVPETTVLDLLPGDIFVHRNIANVVSAGDMSVLSVVQFAVEVVQVKHVIVCGHYGCGGCIAALGNKKLGLLDNWLRHIRDVRATHAQELESLPDITARANRLAELKYYLVGRVANCSVAAQVNSVKRIPTVQEAMVQRGLQVHGWVFDVSSGLVEPLDVTPDVAEAEYQVVDSNVI